MSLLHKWAAGLAVLAIVAGVTWWWKAVKPAREGPLTEQRAEAAARAYLDLEARERAVEASLWMPELNAAFHEDELLRWWDSLNRAPDPWTVLAEFPLTTLVLPDLGALESLPEGIQRRKLHSGGAFLDRQARQLWLQHWNETGWKLGRTTWALTGHQIPRAGEAARSVLSLTAQLEHPSQRRRCRLHLVASLEWRTGVVSLPELERLEIQDGEVLWREGDPPFRLWLEALIPAERSIFTDPLLLWDLDADGFPEICLVGADRVWWNQPGPGSSRTFREQPWLGLPPERIVAAVRADVSGDGHDDLVLVDGRGVRWWPGGVVGGPAPGPPVEAWTAPSALRHPQCVAAGDLDGDGDVDLWITQYKLPYQGGQFPTPWDDANDGFPSYLLRNDGAGRFTDVTAGSGLAAKRFRRTYSASFVDLDLDGDLDLVNVSDFAGLDVYLNQGSGVFADITGELGSARHAFGMSHAVNDLNHDGRPDLLMLGMNSTVADRLGFLGLERGERDRLRMQEMAFGNRLFLGNSGPVPLRPAPERWAVGWMRTGWTWGAAWTDIDLDGFLDLAVANGHETRASVKDYERQFWRHDRFVGGSANDPVADLYFRTAAGQRQADGASYGGWQSNMLLLNAANRGRWDVAWLWGLAVPEDCRNLLVEDLDGDGRPDLVVTTQEEWPHRRQRLLVFRNELSVGNWVGFRWNGPFPSGARFELETTSGRSARWTLTGDGYRSQGTARVQFGLGSEIPSRVVVHRAGRSPVSGSVVVGTWQEISAALP